MSSMTHYSRHAQARQQQRGIPGFVIESLIQFGKPNYDPLEQTLVKVAGLIKPSRDVPDGTQELVPLVQSNNPEYEARRAEAMRKPGAVIGQATVREP